MVCSAYGCECYINDELVQKKVHTLHPLINAVATQDEDKIYLKIVNVSDREEEVRITADCTVEEKILTEVLAAEPWEINSFEDKEHVSSVCGSISGGSDFTYSAPAHSVNVLVMDKR